MTCAHRISVGYCDVVGFRLAESWCARFCQWGADPERVRIERTRLETLVNRIGHVRAVDPAMLAHVERQAAAMGRGCCG
jgi:hypothetical protein